MTADLVLTGLRVGYGGAPVVDGLDLTVPAGTLTALLGPSGCGKSTLLRAVAGLVEPAAGEIRVGGSALRGIAAERRPVELPGLAARRVAELSGGQEQRVALARALVLDPQVLLLDEPFSQLDAELRVRVRELVAAVQRELGITTLFVTHDRHEAMEVADAVALMHSGRIEAHGPPAALYADPPTLRAARALGEVNALPGRRDGTVFSCAVGPVQVAAGPDGPGTLLVRPEAVLLGHGAGAVVRSVRFRGGHARVMVSPPTGVELVASVPPGPAVGDVVGVSLAPHAGRVLPGNVRGHAG